jgi:hypothetical protein
VDSIELPLRNVGQTNSVYAGLLYAVNLKKETRKDEK